MDRSGEEIVTVLLPLEDITVKLGYQRQIEDLLKNSDMVNDWEGGRGHHALGIHLGNEGDPGMIWKEGEIVTSTNEYEMGLGIPGNAVYTIFMI